jgi:hypothetical protein
MADMLSILPAGGITPPPAPVEAPIEQPLPPEFSDEEILALWKDIKAETIDENWVFSRQYQRNLWYMLNRQWIEYQSRYGGWRDKRMASWIPRPVTNKCKETVQSIRAMFTSIKLSVNVRPNGADPKNVSSAATADELSPLLHEVHQMNQVMSEFDFWLCVCGNAFIHTYMDYDIKHGEIVITAEECLGCGEVYPSNELAGAQPTCKGCGGTQFQQATDPLTGEPIEERKVKGMPTTTVLSPLELSFRQSYTRFEDLPELVRSRRRTKKYYEAQPSMADLVPKIVWDKQPAGHNLALFTSLGQANDLGVSGSSYAEGLGRGGPQEDGITEHEVWMKPTVKYPKGLVFRVIGDANPIVVRIPEEGLPGELPYSDADGNKLFTFAHATYEHVGGRILGSGVLDAIIQKQDQLNQLDSLILLIIQRMANPVWIEPKGCEIQKLTGMPGLVVKYKTDPMNPNGKPERLPGIGPDASLFTIREQYLRDIEELSGTFDIMKGQKPAGVEAFSAIQALIERSQARFASVFTSRGDAYKNWFKFAIELEREFGPDERTKAVLTPSRGYTFETFKRSQLGGSLTIVVEDGSTTPKTNLGMRASIEHANTLGMLNMQDPDQQYEGLKLFGLTRMVPSLDIHVQSALQKQEAFENWIKDPANVETFMMNAQAQQAEYQQTVEQFGADQQVALAPQDPNAQMPTPPPAPPSMLVGTPLEWSPWFNAPIHMQEFLKWANDDHIRELIATTPITKELLKMHMEEMAMALMPPPGAPTEDGAPPPAQGAGKSMSNSNANSAPSGNTAQPPQR